MLFFWVKHMHSGWFGNMMPRIRLTHLLFRDRTPGPACRDGHSMSHLVNVAPEVFDPTVAADGDHALAVADLAGNFYRGSHIESG